MHRAYKIVVVVVLASVVYLAAVVFAPTGSVLNLASAPKGVPEASRGDLTILLVPGHNNTEPGARFGGVSENDLVIELSQLVKDELSSREGLQVLLSRTEGGEFSPWLAHYMETNREEIEYFRDSIRKSRERAIAAGLLEPELRVLHNFATPLASFELYAINKFIDEKGIDLALHLHFNDDGERSEAEAGKYRGFAIYTPDTQLPNSEESLVLAEILFDELSAVTPVSNLPTERAGIVPEQDFIALGSGGSSTKPSILVEYGYIYEEGIDMAALSRATVLGIEKYFDTMSADE